MVDLAVAVLVIALAVLPAVAWQLGRRRQIETRRSVSWKGRLVDEHYQDGELVGRTVHDFDSHGRPVRRVFDADWNRVREVRDRCLSDVGRWIASRISRR